MKHLSKKILIFIIVIAVIATATVVFFACQPKSKPLPAPKNVYTVSMKPPTDGTSPNDHSGLNNIAFMAGRLADRRFYHSENKNFVDTITKQNVVGTKDYYDGILITQAISTSTFVSVAQQKFFAQDKVVVRGPKYDKNKWNGIHTEWSDNAPIAVLSRQQYTDAYGLWASEFSDYVLNEETVLESSELSTTEDGKFRQTFTLDPVGATYYYSRNMRTMGNLGDYPTFSSVQLTFTFDDSWTVWQIDIVEEYKVSISVLNVGCKATSSIVYSYDETDVDVSAYENYFKKYADAPVTGNTDQELGVVDYLQNGFLNYIAQPAAFNVSATINDASVQGKILINRFDPVAQDLELLAAIGDLRIQADMQTLYIDYRDFIGKLEYSDLFGILNSSGTGGSAQLDTDLLLEQIGSGTIEKEGEQVKISCSLDLFGITVPLTFEFTDRNGAIGFVRASASLQIASFAIDVVLEGCAYEEIEGVDTEAAVDLKPYIEGILSLAQDKSFSVSVDYLNRELGFAVVGEAYVNAAEGAVSGNLQILYGDLKVPVSFTYVEHEIWVKVYNIGIRTTEEYVVSAVRTALEQANVALPSFDDFDFAAVLSAALTVDYNRVIQTLRLTESELMLTVDPAPLLELLLPNAPSLGLLSVEYVPEENLFSLSVFGVHARLRGIAPRAVKIPADSGSYVDLKLFESFVEPITALIDSKDIAFGFALDAEIRGIQIVGTLAGEVKFVNGTEIYLQAEIGGKRVGILYKEDTLYVEAAGQKMKLSVADVREVGEKLTTLLGKTDENKEILALFSSEGLDLQALLESLRLTGAEENGAAILQLYVDLGVLDGNLSELGVKLHTDGEKLYVSTLESVNLYGLQLNRLDSYVYAAEDEYEYDFADAVDLKPYLDSVFGILENKSFEITADYANEELGLAVVGRVYANAATGSASGELSVTYKDIKIPVTFTYVNEEIYLGIYQIKLYTTVAYLSEAIQTAMEYIPQPLPSAQSVEASKIINAVIAADWTKFVRSFSITDEKLSLTLDLDALLSQVTETELKPGLVTAEFNPTESRFELNVSGVDATLQSVLPREINAPADSAEYVDIDLFVQFIQPAWELANSKDIAFGFALDAEIRGIQIVGTLAGEVKFANGTEIYLQAEIGGKRVGILYKEDTLYVEAAGQKMKLSVADVREVGEKLTTLLGKTDENKEILALFSSEGLDLQALLESLRLTGAEENGAAILQLYVDLGVLDGNLSELGVKLHTDGEKLYVSTLESVNLYGLQLNRLDSYVYAAEDEYEYDFADAVDLKPYLDSVFGILENKSFEITADYANEELGLAVVGRVYANAATGSASGELSVTYKDIKIPVTFTYVNEEIYLGIYQIKLYTTVAYLSEAIQTAMEYIPQPLPSAQSVEASKIINAVIAADWTKFVKSFSITDEKLSLTLDLDALLSQITETELKPGPVTAEFNPTESRFELSVSGVDATLQSVTPREIAAPADSAEYVDIDLFAQFIQPVWDIVRGNDIALTFSFATRIMDLDMRVNLSAEIIREPAMQIYLKAELFWDGYADEIIELLYAEGMITIVYEGRAMQISEAQISRLAEQLGGMFASGKTQALGDGYNAAMLLFSEDGIDLQALLESLKIFGSSQENFTALDIFADLGILNPNLTTVDFRLATDGKNISVALNKPTQLFGLSVDELCVSAFAAEERVYNFDFAGVSVCDNVFEFILNAYIALADTQYLRAEIGYRSDTLTADVSALLELLPMENSTEVNFNVSATVSLHTYAINENGERAENGSHYLSLVIEGETAYVGYSLAGVNASGGLYVSIPVEQLFVIGRMVMPLLTIDPDTYFYSLVENLFSENYKKLTSAILNGVNFEDILKLLQGVSASKQEKTQSKPESQSRGIESFAFGKNEQGEVQITVNGIGLGKGDYIDLALIAQREGSVAHDASKTYIDVSSLAILVGDVLHAYEYTATGYELSGEVSLSILGIELDLKVSVNLRVGVNPDGSMYLNLRLNVKEYENYLVWGFFGGKKCVINGNTQTDISLRDGILYMTRLRTSEWNNKDWAGMGGKFVSITPEYLYRRMTVEEFGADAINQIFWAINLSSGAQKYIGEQIGKSGSSGGTTKKYDAGDMVQGYTFGNNAYNLKLNLGAIANSSALGTLDLKITRRQNEGKSYFDLTDLQGSISLVSIITAKFNLTHTSCGAAVDLSVVDSNIGRVNANLGMSAVALAA